MYKLLYIQNHAEDVGLCWVAAVSGKVSHVSMGISGVWKFHLSLKGFQSKGGKVENQVG